MSSLRKTREGESHVCADGDLCCNCRGVKNCAKKLDREGWEKCQLTDRPTDRQTDRKKEPIWYSDYIRPTDDSSLIWTHFLKDFIFQHRLRYMVYFRKTQAANNKLLRLFYEFKLYENGTYDFFINDYISHDI